MTEKTTSFDKVMTIVATYYARLNGDDVGMLTWLAGGIGITRQAVNGFKERGRFPTKYLMEISKFTGIPMGRFDTILAEEVLALSRKWRMSIRDTEEALIHIGLDNTNRK